MQEEWRAIPGFENYEASNLGNIRRSQNCAFRPNKSGKMLSPQVRPQKGYLAVWVNFGKGNRKYVCVHRLVLFAFLGVSNLEVNHKNGIKTDNRLENLEYVTRQENRTHAVENGLHYSKLKKQDVEEINSLLELGMTCKSIAKRYSVNPSLISLIKRREIHVVKEAA